METLNIKLENCYGIRKLEKALDFTGNGAVAIYAPNGSMKSSLAKVFKDIGESVESKDRIFPARVTHRSITDEAGAELDKNYIFVVKNYDEVLGHNEKTSTLLVNSDLRKQYEALHAEINSAKDLLLKHLKKLAKTKKNIEKEIAATFTSDDTDFFTALRRVREEVEALGEPAYSHIEYDTIFDAKSIDFLSKPEVASAIADYIQGYNALLKKSTYFKRGVFNYYNASTIAKNLASNGFFSAKHTLQLNGDKATEIKDAEQLETLIQEERDSIFNDPALKKKLEAIEKQINQNIDLRELHRHLLEHEDILPHLANLGKFKEELWKSYLKGAVEPYLDLLKKHAAAETQKEVIAEQAGEERTQWEEVIRIFNERFSVPFRLEAANRIQVILGQDAMLSLSFTFEEGDDHVQVDKGNLMQVLSTGEQKAFYVLNVIFEMEVRKRAQQPTLFIVDDIADSFDYKNKYAIIEYLRDMSEEAPFRQLLLTHNFDFFRTANSRYVRRSQCFMAVKSADEVKLEPAVGLKNIFKHWKGDFYADSKKKIALIPFIRNIVEYTEGTNDPKYIALTSLVHVKADSAGMTVRLLDEAFQDVFGGIGSSADPDISVFDLITQTANECLDAQQGTNFENKIVLSIAIRLEAERYMIGRINDEAFVSDIQSNQTDKLHQRFKSDFPQESHALDVMRRVMLMTPESIHLNSFMFEPILDMSDDHLKKLYRAVRELNA